MHGISKVRTKPSFVHQLFFGTSKISIGQVHYGHLLVPVQVSNFTISTHLSLFSLLNTRKTFQLKTLTGM